MESVRESNTLTHARTSVPGTCNKSCPSTALYHFSFHCNAHNIVADMDLKKYNPKPNSLDGIDIGEVLNQVLQPFDVLMCGKTGVGKSSLINSLTGWEAQREVNDPAETGNFGAGTTTVDPTLINLSGVLLRVWDSPGLQDNSVHEEDYLEEMYEKCKDVNIVLYCMDMTVTRWTPSEVRATELLTEKFGVDFWKKVVLVLTKANSVRIPGKYKGKETTYHKQLYVNLVKQFRDQLVQQGVPQDVAANLHTVAVGYSDPDDENEEERYIYYTSDKAKISKENVQYDFMPELWISCLERLPEVSRAQFVKMTESRMKPDLPIYDQVISEDLQDALKNQELRERLEREKCEELMMKLDYMQKQLDKAHRPRPSTIPPIIIPINEYADRLGISVVVPAMAGAAAGAAIGSLLGPIGTVAGGLIGALGGALAAALEA